jgi:hypothetical protein
VPASRAKVQAKLEADSSPEEISGWLARTYPNNPEMSEHVRFSVDTGVEVYF